MDPNHHPSALVGTSLLALSALAILVSFRALLLLFPYPSYRSDDDRDGATPAAADVPFPTSTLATLSFVPLLIFLMVRYVSLRLYLRN